jgi:hypothetical protein
MQMENHSETVKHLTPQDFYINMKNGFEKIAQTIIDLKSVAMHIIITGVMSPVIFFVEKYIFSDWEFAIFLTIICVLDTAAGAYSALKNKKFSLHNLFQQPIEKALIYMGLLCVGHILSNFTIKHDVNIFFQWFDIVAYSLLITKEAISFVKNLSKIQKDKIPQWIIDKLENVTKEKIEKLN